jgi:hypothetical protein
MIIERKKGIINGIIYDNTVYHNGEFRIYPTISGLKWLIREIVKSNSTTEYIRITPFYVNEKLNRQIEFDEYMFYLECRDYFDDNELRDHIGLCFGKEYVIMEDEEIRHCKILFPLCKNNDVEAYKRLLEAYVKFLDELIPKLMEICKLKMSLKDNDFAFGYFCFEVHNK